MKIDFAKITPIANFFLLLAAVVGGVYGAYSYVKDSGAKEAAEIELMFPDAETKHRTIIHVKDTEEVIDELKSVLKAEKENKESAVKSRAIRDSIQKEYLELARRNAVSAHQNKQGIDSVLKLWKEYNDNAEND